MRNSQKQETAKKKNFPLFSFIDGADLTVVFSLFSVLSVAFMYFYTESQFRYYGVPAELIEIKLINFTGTLFYLLILCLLLAQFISLFSSSEAYSKMYSKRWYTKILFVFSFLITALLVLSKSTDFFVTSEYDKAFTFLLTIGTIIVFLLIFSEITYLVRRKNSGTHNQSVWYISAGIGVLMLSSALGYFQAYFKTAYYVTTEEPRQVVVGKYNGHLIVAPVDLKKGVIKRQYGILKMESKDGKPILESMHTGKLKVEEPRIK
ncbi:hypothetical protein L2D08_07330 [Domibacillus sp. PGB-M46]|uniref:hypothetical protein n=1 Tax=Domibacillus sp. PGB-M46 TaxID=2910255 RepID=UPI001F5906BF|nr:hypothetical protein [Domibacillus sp. PGB-M46]MCI2254173.1 hypothetical protein [Domibacillus sp. PGB-M46]